MRGPDGLGRLPEIDLSPDTVLQLAPNFRTRLDAAGHVIVDSPVGTIVDIGPRGFAILAMFSRPLTLGDALERLETELGGSTDLAPTLSVINMLIEENTLITRGFYDRLGYRTVGIIDNCPAGTATRWYCKDL
jgi:hypothetical protein